jgi:hypothetical protein
MPIYPGIASLENEGDSILYGGPRLCEGGKCLTRDGQAAFVALALPEVAARE